MQYPLYLYAVFILLDKLLNMFLNVDLTFGNTWRTAYFCSVKNETIVNMCHSKFKKIMASYSIVHVFVKWRTQLLDL